VSISLNRFIYGNAYISGQSDRTRNCLYVAVILHERHHNDGSLFLNGVEICYIFDLKDYHGKQIKHITDFNSIKKKASVIMMSFMQNNSYIQTVACSIGLPRNIGITINEAIQGNRHDKAVIIECGINIM
jgi:hypothetical protein